MINFIRSLSDAVKAIVRVHRVHKQLTSWRPPSGIDVSTKVGVDGTVIVNLEGAVGGATLDIRPDNPLGAPLFEAMDEVAHAILAADDEWANGCQCPRCKAEELLSAPLAEAAQEFERAVAGVVGGRRSTPGEG